jgi:dihydrodiol dehydrogenase / D-xylose 1-dehydrogenase (NADP)
LAAGLTGEVKSLESSFGFCLPKNLDDRTYNHDLAGGALLDMGIYNITLSQWVYGENPKSIQAMSLLAETNVDEHTLVTMQYSKGRFSKFTCSFLAKHRNDFCIYGTKGHIKIHDIFWCSNEATLVTDSRNEDEENLTLKA